MIVVDWLFWVLRRIGDIPVIEPRSDRTKHNQLEYKLYL